MQYEANGEKPLDSFCVLLIYLFDILDFLFIYFFDK